MRVLMRKERKKDKEDLLSQMAAIMRVNSIKTKSLVSVITTGQMENHTQETGQRTKWTVTVLLSGETVKNMKEISLTTREKDKALLFGLMVDSILENGKLENSTVSVLTSAKMVLQDKVSGLMVENRDGSVMKLVITIWEKVKMIDPKSQSNLCINIF